MGYKYQKEAEKLGAMGRNGDSILMHINPLEVQAIEKMHPGSISINPDTGQPEAFFFLLPALLSTLTAGLGSAAGLGAAVGIPGMAAASGALGTLGGIGTAAGAGGLAGSLGTLTGVMGGGGLGTALGGSVAPTVGTAAAAPAVGSIGAETVGAVNTGALTTAPTIPVQSILNPPAPPSVLAGQTPQWGLPAGGNPPIAAQSLGPVAAQPMGGLPEASRSLLQAGAPKTTMFSPGAPTGPGLASGIGGKAGDAVSKIGADLARQVSGPSGTLESGIQSGLDGVKKALAGQVPKVPEQTMTIPQQMASQILDRGGLPQGLPQGVTRGVTADAGGFANVPSGAQRLASNTIRPDASLFNPQVTVDLQSKAGIVPTVRPPQTGIGGANMDLGTLNEGMFKTPTIDLQSKAGIVPGGNVVAPSSFADNMSGAGKWAWDKSKSGLGTLGTKSLENPILPLGMAYMMDKWTQDPKEAPEWAKRSKGTGPGEIWSDDYQMQVMPTFQGMEGPGDWEDQWYVDQFNPYGHDRYTRAAHGGYISPRRWRR